MRFVAVLADLGLRRRRSCAMQNCSRREALGTVVGAAVPNSPEAAPPPRRSPITKRARSTERQGGPPTAGPGRSLRTRTQALSHHRWCRPQPTAEEATMPAPMPIPHANLPSPSAQANVTPLAVPPSAAGYMLSLSLSEVYERLRDGSLESYQDGRARRITMKSIHAYMAGRLANSANGWQQITPQPPRRRGQASKAHG